MFGTGAAFIQLRAAFNNIFACPAVLICGRRLLKEGVCLE